jgi:hypothetical protein
MESGHKPFDATITSVGANGVTLHTTAGTTVVLGMQE